MSEQPSTKKSDVTKILTTVLQRAWYHLLQGGLMLIIDTNSLISPIVKEEKLIRINMIKTNVINTHNWRSSIISRLEA